MHTHDLARDRIPVVLNLGSTASIAAPSSTVCIPSAISHIFCHAPTRPNNRHLNRRPIYNNRTLQTSLPHPGDELVIIPSPDGHDGFLLEVLRREFRRMGRRAESDSARR